MRWLKSVVDAHAGREPRGKTLGFAIFTVAAVVLAVYGWQVSVGNSSYFTTSEVAYQAYEAAATRWAVLSGIAMFMASFWPLSVLAKALNKTRSETGYIRFYRRLSLALWFVIVAMAAVLIFLITSRLTTSPVACTVQSTGQTTCRNQ